jgi:hypothetical protein
MRINDVKTCGSAASPIGRRARKGATNGHRSHRNVELHRGGGSPSTITAALKVDDFLAPSGWRWQTTTDAGPIRELALVFWAPAGSMWPHDEAAS